MSTAAADSAPAWRSGTIQAIAGAMQRMGASGTSLRRFAAALGPAACPLLLLVLALPNAVPIGPPGIGILFALPLLALVPAILHPRQRVGLPRRFARMRLESRQLQWILPRLDRVLALIERVGRPRLPSWLERRGRYAIAATVALMALLIVLPLPTGNPPSAASIMIFAAGLLRQDGLLVIIGHASALLALAWNLVVAALIVFAGVEVWSLF